MFLLLNSKKIKNKSCRYMLHFITLKYSVMKTSRLFFTAALFFCFALTGCKKYTCECTAYNSGNPESYGHSNYKLKGSARDRKRDCTDHSTKPDVHGNHTECVIK